MIGTVNKYSEVTRDICQLLWVAFPHHRSSNCLPTSVQQYQITQSAKNKHLNKCDHTYGICLQMPKKSKTANWTRITVTLSAPITVNLKC